MKHWVRVETYLGYLYSENRKPEQRKKYMYLVPKKFLFSLARGKYFSEEEKQRNQRLNCAWPVTVFISAVDTASRGWGCWCGSACWLFPACLAAPSSPHSSCVHLMAHWTDSSMKLWSFKMYMTTTTKMTHYSWLWPVDTSCCFRI